MVQKLGHIEQGHTSLSICLEKFCFKVSLPHSTLLESHPLGTSQKVHKMKNYHEIIPTAGERSCQRLRVRSLNNGNYKMNSHDERPRRRQDLWIFDIHTYITFDTYIIGVLIHQ